MIIGHVELADAEACPSRFKDLLKGLRPNIGTPAKLKGFEDDEVRLLGSGEVGGHVYLVNPKDHSAPFVVKDYDIGGPMVAENDRLGLHVLDQALNDEAHVSALHSVHVLEKMDAKRLKLEYAPGQDVQEIDWSAGQEAKRMNRIFYRQLREAKHKLEERGSYEIEGSRYMIVDSRLEERGRNGGPELNMVLRNVDSTARTAVIRIKIKTDNVVFSSGQFMVIDPY